MAQNVARITCPNCKQPFGTPLEQVLDVELDPSAKARLLSGQVNLVGCPHCGMVGSVNTPFVYHDPEKELALIFMPMEAGRDDMERQQLIGALSRAVMNQLPPEQRKGYLLNPQIFFSHESLVGRILEADGITPEMIEAQRAKVDLLRRLLEATSPEERMALVNESAAVVDDEFFRLLHANLAQAEMMEQQDLALRLTELRTLLFEQTDVGRRLAARADSLRALQEQPTRERLVELLVQSEDPDTRAALIAFGQPLVDYLFFQTLTQQIENTQDEAERKRLEAVRQEVLDVRQEMQEQARQVVDARATLLRDLLTTEQPELLARRHLAELDELFFNVLAAQIEQARQNGDDQGLAQLQEAWQLTMRLIQEQVPPELALLTRLLEADDIEEIQQTLEANRDLVSEQFVAMLERVEQDLREREETGPARRAAAALAAARTIAGSSTDGGTSGQLEVAR